jgi:hypothetical protein
MRVELRGQDGVRGEVNLVGGLATPSNEFARRTIDETNVALPGRPPKPMTPADGEDYLRGLAASLRGTYLWAVLADA